MGSKSAFAGPKTDFKINAVKRFLTMKFTMKFFLFCLMIQPLFSLCAGGEMPVSFILFQALNFTLFLLIIIYFLLKKTPAMLKRKQKDYLSMNAKAQDLYQTAKDKNKEMKEKLRQMDDRLARFQGELDQKVTEMEKNISKETQALCENIKKGVQSAVEREIIQIKQELKNDLLKQVEILCRKAKQEETKTVDIFLKKLSKTPLIQ